MLSSKRSKIRFARSQQRRLKTLFSNSKKAATRIVRTFVENVNCCLHCACRTLYTIINLHNPRGQAIKIFDLITHSEGGLCFRIISQSSGEIWQSKGTLQGTKSLRANLTPALQNFCSFSNLHTSNALVCNNNHINKRCVNFHTLKRN